MMEAVHYAHFTVYHTDEHYPFSQGSNCPVCEKEARDYEEFRIEMSELGVTNEREIEALWESRQ